MAIAVTNDDGQTVTGNTKLAPLANESGTYDTVVAGTGHLFLKLHEGDKVSLAITRLPFIVSTSGETTTAESSTYFFDGLTIDSIDDLSDEVAYLSLSKINKK